MASKIEKIWIPAIRRRGSPVLFLSFMMAAFDDRYFQEILLLPRGIHDNKYLDGFFILEANDAGTLAGSFAVRIEPNYLTYFIRKCEAESDHLLATAKHIRARAPYDALSNAEVTVLFTEYFSDSIRVFIFLPTMVVLEGVLQKALTERLQNLVAARGYSEAELQSFLNALIFPNDKSIPSHALQGLYELAAYVKLSQPLRTLFEEEVSVALPRIKLTDPEFYRRFEGYRDTYDFLEMEDFVGRPLPAEELFSRVRDVIDASESRLTHIKEEEARTMREFQRACDRLQLPSDLRSLFDCARNIHYQRQYRSDAIHKGARDLFDLMNTIAARLATNYDKLIALTSSEITSSLVAGRLLVDEQTIRARRTGYGIRRIDGKWSIITGQDLADELASLPAHEQPSEIRGHVAYPGKYRGRVAIVTTKDEINKVRQGDVLVSPMTNPHFVPAMVRAGAIVTDEGGILSHAAIVSRELGVPCIIGTHVATTLLNDGDLVEVSAEGDSGTVIVVK